MKLNFEELEPEVEADEAEVEEVPDENDVEPEPDPAEEAEEEARGEGVVTVAFFVVPSPSLLLFFVLSFSFVLSFVFFSVLLFILDPDEYPEPDLEFIPVVVPEFNPEPGPEVDVGFPCPFATTPKRGNPISSKGLLLSSLNLCELANKILSPVDEDIILAFVHSPFFAWLEE